MRGMLFNYFLKEPPNKNISFNILKRNDLIICEPEIRGQINEVCTLLLWLEDKSGGWGLATTANFPLYCVDPCSGISFEGLKSVST